MPGEGWEGKSEVLQYILAEFLTSGGTATDLNGSLSDYLNSLYNFKKDY